MVLEKLSVADMRFKSRAGNRMLKAGQLGHVAELTRRRLDVAGIAWLEVNPAHTSQECPHCGFSMRINRTTQARFRCAVCGFGQNADTKAALVVMGRSHDDELNAARHWQVGTILAERFMRRWHGGCPPPAPGGSPCFRGMKLPASGPPVGDAEHGLVSTRIACRAGSPTGTPEGHPLGALNPKQTE